MFGKCIGKSPLKGLFGWCRILRYHVIDLFFSQLKNEILRKPSFFNGLICLIYPNLTTDGYFIAKKTGSLWSPPS